MQGNGDAVFLAWVACCFTNTTLRSLVFKVALLQYGNVYFFLKGVYKKATQTETEHSLESCCGEFSLHSQSSSRSGFPPIVPETDPNQLLNR